jgi:hypothetical protein
MCRGYMPPKQIGSLEGDATVLAEQLGPPHRLEHALSTARRHRRQSEIHIIICLKCTIILDKSFVTYLIDLCNVHQSGR